MPPAIDLDPEKDAANLAKHGLSLARAVELEWGDAEIIPDNRRDYGEDRFIAYGGLAGRLHVAIFTRRGETYRIISLRRANQREVRRHGRR